MIKRKNLDLERSILITGVRLWPYKSWMCDMFGLKTQVESTSKTRTCCFMRGCGQVRLRSGWKIIMECLQNFLK